MTSPVHSKSRRHLIAAAAAAALAGALPLSALSQENYPNKPVRIVIPYAAGGAGDVVIRLVATHLQSQLGQPFVVENRPGAGGATGGAFVAKSPPDGYTLAFASIGYNLMGAMQSNLSFDPGKDLAPIGMICTQPYVLDARMDAPFKTVPEMVAYAKTHPGEVKLAHAGVGTLIHLFGTWLAAETKITLNEIPYGGSAPALNSILSGQTDVYFDPPSNSLPHLNAGKLRAMATTGETRMPALKDVPTLKELGYPISGETWFGLMAPTGTPKPIIDKLNKELNILLRSDEVKQRMEALNYSVQTGSPEQFGKFFNDQTASWTKIVKDNNVKPPAQ
ncbi:tripartite tricarboxylate transporter substrate binding protein [soil metagenome]